MNKYPRLKQAFSYFGAYTDQVINEYRRDFSEGILCGNIEPSSLRQEIEVSLEDKGFSWVALAKEEDFIYYREGHSEEQVFNSFKLLTWDLLFPEEVMSKEEIIALYEKTMSILLTVQKDDWLLIDDLFEQLKSYYPNIDTYELLRMNRDIAQGRIKIRPDKQNKLYLRTNIN